MKFGSAWKQKVVQSFDVCAHEYDQYGFVQEKIAQSLAGDLPDFESPDVLEIGCGTGMLTRYLLDSYKDGRFHITDISPQMLVRARTRIREHIGSAAEVEWGVMDGENLAGDQRCYDLIIGNMVFQWFENADGALEKLVQRLKPGGVLLYSVPAPTCFKEWRAALADLSLEGGISNFETLPGVFRKEEIIEKHKTTLHFLQNMKKIGAHTPRDGYKKLGYADLLGACRWADEKFKGQMTWHILYGRLNSRFRANG